MPQPDRSISQILLRCVCKQNIKLKISTKTYGSHGLLKKSPCVHFLSLSHWNCSAFWNKWGRVYTLCPSTAPEYGSRWVLMWTHPFFKYVRENSGTVPVPGYKVSTLCSSIKVGTGWGDPCVHTIFVSSGQSNAFFSLLSSCFKLNGVRQGEMEKLCIQSHIGYSRYDHNTILCRYPFTTCGQPLSHGGMMSANRSI